MERRPVRFYREVLAALKKADVPFLVGGAFAFCRYAGIDRRTKDLDLMIERRSWPDLARALRTVGIHTKLTFPHWLGKALSPAGQVDVIFNGGSGLTPVDAEYFAYGVRTTVLGFNAVLCPPEELLWSKAFIMERERFDGADVLHLIRAQAQNFDWRRLRRRFIGHEAVLRAHLILFKYVYPSEAHLVPEWIEDDLQLNETPAPVTTPPICRGTNLSRAQYLVDLDEWGYADARLAPFGSMADRHWVIWTNSIDTRRSSIRGGHRKNVPRRPRTPDLQET